ncbi:GNAT family N-acetyltransferase [Geodermatophilus nigrescens]|uniref:Acetyltransferase (GNAT) domain-containing protein n=1 Tax=Geodermatophilus nigrescens TaxID=1070870 RepID=A0A1M5EVA6_9ACTN|nr:GNAT family N-acetyltransferase [Geodermatophilus nigrescens]SHF82962.1 Acetyltransferase (GNAT) domain-containing protein [Geodermatophilus nigrescens]
MPAAQDDLRVDTAIGPLLLRRPGADDLPAVWAVHGDPRTDRHDPAGPDADAAASRDRLREWLDHWERHGFGYSAVETDEGRVVGFSGVRTSAWDGVPVLAFTTVDDTGSRRTALAAGLVRRPDLERVVDGHWAVVFTTPPAG